MPHLTFSQRCQIGSLRHLKPAEIARRIGHHRALITCELARTGPTRHAYQPQTAHKRAAQRKKANALKTTLALTATIAEGLAKQWSPDQLKGRCSAPAQLGGHLCLYLARPAAERLAVQGPAPRQSSLPQARWQTRRARPSGQGAAKPRIGPRPAVAAENSRVGDGELDTVGPQQQGGLVTSTGRRSNYLLLQLVDDKLVAQTRQAIIGGLRQSGLLVHPLPSDNGTEFADYAQIAKALNTPVLYPIIFFSGSLTYL